MSPIDFEVKGQDQTAAFGGKISLDPALLKYRQTVLCLMFRSKVKVKQLV